MTATEIIIKCLDENGVYPCRVYSCYLPDKEGNTGEGCHKCTLDILAEHDAKVRTAAIDEYNAALKECLLSIGDIDSEDIDYVAKKLKEKNNEKTNRG